ncbi:MAG: capsule assembly Wzi family protein [Muribaculaceae bacterium]
MRLLALAAVSAVCATMATAQSGLKYEAGATVNVSDGALAPYYVASNRGATLTQGNSALVNGAVWHECDSTRRFSFGYGFEAWTGWSSTVNYQRYDVAQQTFVPNGQHQSLVWVQQLYAEVKYRSLFAVLGQKEHRNSLTDAALSSGDLVLSGNARPMPGLRAGFIDFQDIPFTNGWVQIDGEIAYYKDLQTDWLENHYNMYNHFITTGCWVNYKRCYFRTKPQERLSVTVGMQAACQFLGTKRTFEKGEMVSEHKSKSSFKTFWKAFLPASGSSGSSDGDQAYYEGNHLGSWDLAVRYNLGGDRSLKAYYQSPFEDGSGIGKLNGWDGLYGIEYRSRNKAAVTGAAVEYIDFTNQSGPIHWAPGDFPDSPIRDEATGADNYYNNYYYNGYSQMGMSIGTPFMKSPLYNRDGYMAYTDTRMRGFHAAVTGYVTPEVAYRLMGSYRKSWGTPFIPATTHRTATSLMAEAVYSPSRLPQLSFKAQLALDRGTLYGDNFGAVLSVTFSGFGGK